MGPLLFPTVFWCDAPEAGLIGAVSLFKFRRIKHLVVGDDHPRLPMVPFTGDRGFESISLQRRVRCEPRHCCDPSIRLARSRTKVFPLRPKNSCSMWIARL